MLVKKLYPPHNNRMTRFIFIVVLSLLFQSHAMFRRVETTPVPVDRILTNFTKRALTETNNFELLHVIARLHSLSHARAASNWTAEVIKMKVPNRSIKGEELVDVPEVPPREVHAPNTPEQKAKASEHLNEAIKFYRQAATLKPTNQLVLLGYGWCQIQAGQTNQAKAILRRAVQTAWQSERSLPGFLDLRSTTEEAIDYLLPLLDPGKDEAERTTLIAMKADANALVKSYHWVTPILLPLQPNLAPSALINTNASVAFDLDGSANPNLRWQWITTNAAWIVHLPQGGRVTSALQMFGNVTFWMFWENGYHALGSLDDNADGLLTGDELRGIRLWHDRNSDGICDPTEILELSQLGITALDTHYTNQNEVLSSPSGARFVDGSTRPTFDLILHSR